MGSVDSIKDPNNNIRIQSDEPINNWDEDYLHRKEFVKAISLFIKALPSNSSNVVGIVGEWGSGKTSVINLLKNELKNKVNIIDLCPWTTDNSKPLTEHILHSLSTVMISNDTNCLKSKYTRLLMFLKSVFSSESLENLDVKTLISAYIKYRKNPYEGITVEDFKKEISKRFSATKKTVIIIDDIDRLVKKEIKELMKTVRSIADFNNVVYILLYDEKIVSKSLNTESYKGADYLKKIVQHRFHMPEIKKADLCNYLENEFKSIFKNYQKTDDLYIQSLSHIIINYGLNMRDCKNLLSSFNIRYVISQNNTYAPDLLMMTFYELFYPNVYRWIGINRNILCDNSIRNYQNEDSIIHEMIKEINPKHYQSLETIFPTIKKKKGYGDQLSIMQSRDLKRVCSSRFIDNYFLLVPEALLFPQSFIDHLVTDASSEEISNIILNAHLNNNLDSLMIDIINNITEPNRIALLSRITCFEAPYANQRLIESDLIRIPLSEKLIKWDCDNSGLPMVDYIKRRMESQSIISIPRLHDYIYRLVDSDYNSTIMSKEDIQLFNQLFLEFIMKHHMDIDLKDYPVFSSIVIIVSELDKTQESNNAIKIVEYHIKDVSDMIYYVSKCKPSIDVFNLISSKLSNDISNNPDVIDLLKKINN